jgi:hypothetical protein
MGYILNAYVEKDKDCSAKELFRCSLEIECRVSWRSYPVCSRTQ